MTLSEALRFTDLKLKEGFQSDGCTFAPELGIKKFCVMHDCLLKFRPSEAGYYLVKMTRLEADNLLFKGICTKGVRYYPVAVIYWLACRILGIVKPLLSDRYNG